MSRRRIAVVTATRAEYGLLQCLLERLRDDELVELQLVVSGTHLSERFGLTVRQIEADGFNIAARVPLPLDDDSALGVTRALAAATTGLGEALQALSPDLVVLLGDRYEMLAAAQAAMVARIPIAHLHGGEATEGAIDEAIRHAISKMAQLHFVAAEPFRQRVIQLGEAPERIWTVGATGLDNIARVALLDEAALQADLGMAFQRPLFLMTYHPETLSQDAPGPALRAALEVLLETGGSVVLTGANADAGSLSIRREAERLAAERPQRLRLVESLGVRRYLSLMAIADAVVGNSSSGLIEAPAMGTPTVDIGARQRGRPRAPSVLHCEADAPALRAAVAQALSPTHRALAAQRQTPYGEAGAAERIAAVLRSHPLEGLLDKRFHSLATQGDRG